MSCFSQRERSAFTFLILSVLQLQPFSFWKSYYSVSFFGDIPVWCKLWDASIPALYSDINPVLIPLFPSLLCRGILFRATVNWIQNPRSTRCLTDSPLWLVSSFHTPQYLQVLRFPRESWPWFRFTLLLSRHLDEGLH